MADILAALEKIRKDPKLTKEFVNNPEAALAKVGVDASKLNVKRIERQGAGRLAATGAAATTVCGSVGCVVCGSVG